MLKKCHYYILAIMTTMESDQPDATTQWHVLTDRSQGATKIKPDELEIMVHRRLFKVSKQDTIFTTAEVI